MEARPYGNSGYKTIAVFGLVSCIVVAVPSLARAHTGLMYSGMDCNETEVCQESMAEDADALKLYRISTALLVLGTLSTRTGEALLMAFALPGVLPAGDSDSVNKDTYALRYLIPAFGLELLGRTLQIAGATTLVKAIDTRIAAHPHTIGFEAKQLLLEDRKIIRIGTIILAVGWEMVVATGLALPWVFGGTYPVCKGDPCSGIFLFGDFVLMLASAVVVIVGGAILGHGLSSWRRHLKEYVVDGTGHPAIASPLAWHF